LKFYKYKYFEEKKKSEDFDDLKQIEFEKIVKDYAILKEQFEE